MWRDPLRRAWAMFALAGVVLYLALRELPELLIGGRGGWNWGGHLLALAGMLALAALVRVRAGLRWRDFGLAWPADLGRASAVTAAALLAAYALNSAAGERLEPVPVQTWLFLASMPGLTEEIAFRGVLQAAAERAAPREWVVAGAPIRLGALLLTLGFVALHGAGAGTLFSVLPAALLYLWLRAQTGSVLVPIVAHNLWNLTVLAASL